MRNIIFALIFGFSTAALAQTPIEIAPDAPDRHIVVHGDTLWGIAAKFLKDPFRWPDVWKMNAEQVKNPHRIYPGQVVILDRSGDQPQLKLAEIKLEPRVHSTPISLEIPAIPAQAIEPFLSQPLVVDQAGFDKAPRIVATQEGRVLTGSGDRIYVSDADPAVKNWLIYRPGKPFVDPDSQEVLGIGAIHLGDARMLDAPPSGNVSVLEVARVKQEIVRGDWLVPASRPDIVNYMPHSPTQEIQGRVLSLYDGAGEGGRSSIVAISRGKRDGVEMGHVLALYRPGPQVTNRFDADKSQQLHQLPDERYGLIFVFRVFDRVAYGLVMEAGRGVIPGDKVRKP